VARLRALMRRSQGIEDFRCGHLQLDMNQGLFLRSGRPLDIAPRESAMLRALITKPGRPVSKDDLYQAIFGDDASHQSDTIDLLAHRLRKRLAGSGAALLTMRGIGYPSGGRTGPRQQGSGMTQTNGKAAQSMRKQLLLMFVICTGLGGALGAIGSTTPWISVCIALAGAPTLWWLAGHCLRPLQELTTTVASRQPEETTPLGHTPAVELEPIVRALNVQWQQQRDALEQQQRFIAEASHQLRTPLAVLKTQVQGVTSGSFRPLTPCPKCCVRWIAQAIWRINCCRRRKWNKRSGTPSGAWWICITLPAKFSVELPP